MDPLTLFMGILTGGIGMAYFMYGKKKQSLAPMLAGAALCIYPYFVTDIWAICGIGLFLIAFPFIFRNL